MAALLDDMNVHRTFLLAITLTLLVFGLTAHSLPAISLCGCVTTPEDGTGVSNLDLCLICQLQTGVHTLSCPTGPNHKNAFHAIDQLSLNPLERVFPVLHPPIA